MKMSLQKVFSFVLALIMVFGLIPVTTLADEVQTASAEALPTSMEGLSIAYPYNTETVQQTGIPASRFEALTFESVRNEVESAQMILSPDFDVTSFELTMGSLKNEKGNIIPSWAFEVYVQHYVTVSGSGNANYWSETFQMYNPTYSENGYDGTYPDALIPQDAAITAGENKISAGKNGGIWVNLNVQGAAPGTYTGTAILTVNGTDMNIPVSVHIYDVSLPEQVHTKSSVGIWWDMVEDGEGYIDRNLADTYFDYLVSKRLMPFDAWSLTRWDEPFAEYAATYLAVSPEISSYGLYYAKNSQGSLDVDTLRTTLTTLINKNITLAQSGSNVDLFAKAYLYFGSICDEPRDDAEYKAVNNITAQLDSLKAELAPMLDAYPSLKASFMNLKHLVTGPNPTDKTYADKTTGSFWNKETFIDDDYGSTPLSGDSYVYVPQYQWLHTDSQRALYENEEELWWYGCCHPISPYPTYHINNSLVSARVESWMRYDYGIDGFVYSSVNIWGDYTNSGIQEFDYWNSYVNNGTPGDQILVLPGSNYGVYGPIGTIRIENIREGNEDYEYLWMLENEYGISDISAYTANLYSGVIPDTDASIHYNNRKALLSKLEELSIAKNGATVIAPGNEGFVRGQEIKPSTSLTIELGNTEELATLSFDYKVTSGTFNISLNPDWDSYYGYFAFNANGKVDNYDGVTVEKLDDGYYRVTFRLSKLTKYNSDPSKNLSFLYIRGAWTDATGYIDNVTYTLQKDEPAFGRVLIAADVHVSAEDANTQEHLRKTLTYAKNNGVDLLIFNGDTVDVGNEANYATLDTIFTEVFGSPEQANVKFIFNMGNHEFYPTSACAHEETDYALQFSLFAAFASKWSDFSAEQGSIYLTEVNGVSYVVAAPSDAWTYEDDGKTVYCAALGGYHDNDIALIDSLIAEATAANPGEPVYLLSHHPWGETYGGASYGMPESKVVTAMRAVMEKYPHLVNVTSHTHFSSLHGRSFAQSMWTTINTGMHTYGKYVDIETDVNGTALDYVNIDGRRYTSVDAEGKALHGATHFVWDINFSEDSFTATIFNMATETVYPYVSYTVPYGITAANKSEKFAYELADRTAPTLTWSAEDVLTAELVKNSSSNTLNLAFNDTDQFYATEGYRIQVVNAATGETLKTVLWASRYWAGQEKKDSYEITVDGVAQCSEYKITVEAIDFYSNYSAAKLVSTVQPSHEEVFRGQQIVSRTDLTIEFGNAEELATLSFDYKLSSGTFNISLNPDWDNAFGYFAFDANGNVDPYDGVTLETLEDGYTRVTFDLNALTKYTGSPSKVLTFLYLRGAWSDATGYIDNVQFTVAGQPEEPAYRGQEINPSTSLTIELGNTEELSTLSFDYKVLSGTFNISLNPDWDNAFGYFAFDANGNVDAYDGVTVETLEDGYYRVTFDLNALTKYSGNPAKTLSFLYIRGAWTDATGYIDNVQYTVYEAPSEPETNRGQEITPSTSLTIELDNVDTLASLSFDYKVTNGTFNISLNPDWDNYFGYFAFDANGNVDAYDGVTVETLEDGYYRVTFDMNALTKYSGNPGKALSFLYIRGAWTDATGYIDNIQYTVTEKPVEPENRGQEFSVNTDLTIDLATTGVLGTLSFDYKITSGEAFNIALMPNWDSYYGYFAFTAEGSVDPYNGVTTEVLEDGYIRVTFDMDALTKVSGTPSKFIDFIYIRGNWTTANGYIDNIQWTEGCEHIYETVAKEPTFTEVGGNVHTCSKCGNSYVTEEIPAYTFQVIQWNIALADDIRANFYLDIDSRLEDAFVTVLVDGYGYKYALSELTTTDKGYYIVSANAAAAQMTDNISLVVSSGDLSSEEKTYTIRQYAEYILTGNYEDNTKLLVQRMLNYGAAAQSYFAYNTGNMANIGYEMTDVPTIPEAEAGSVASGDVVGIDYYGASLLYESKVGVRFYYTVTGRIEDYTFTDSMGNTYEPVAKGGRYYVEVMNINPDQYDDVIEMLVTDGTTTQSVSYSPMRYISRKFYGSDNADLVNLVAQMYQYHKAAETYLGGAESVDVSYSFTGNEANRAGYAEGVVTISNAKAGETYELYWANSTGKLTGYRALGSATLEEGQSNVSFAIAENVMIPAGADRLIVCASGSEEASGTYSLGEKVSAAQLESKFAVISDVHTNYTQGEQYLLSALKRFEAEGVSYVIITGDIGESDSDYAKYVSAVEKSNFSGLIFASIGNHDQIDTGRKNFKTYAIYDGTAKTWVGIDNAPAYFAGSYAGSLNVVVELAGENLAYYVVTIGENAYIFMDQELTSTGNTPSQDNFSKEQLNFVEDKLYQYSATHNLFIIEHAPIEQLKIGDKFDPGYGGAIQLSAAYPNNQRFVELLMEYTEAIWLSGHTHVQYDTGIMYVDKYYDASENLTDTAIAHAVHVSSLAQPRWYEGSSMKMPNDYSAASQGYVCYQYADDIVFEARVFKNYTPDSINLDTSLFVNETESIYSWAIPLENMTHDAPSYDEEEGGEEVTLIDYAVAENGYKRAGSPTWEDTDDGLKVTFAAASDRFEIKTGDQTVAFTNGYTAQFKIKTDLTSFDLGGSNYSGSRKTYIQVNLAASGDQYTVTDLGDGWKLVTIPMSNLGHADVITEFAIRFYNTNAAGSFYLRELYIAPEIAEETAMNYAVAENGNKRAGNPTWEDTDDGLKVTFAAASDRFEIKTGDQTEAFTNGYMVQFKIKTDLTSFDLGGSNYSGSRKTYIQVNLAASGDQYTVTDLGDGWKLVTIPMANLGHSSIITEFAIRFYNTNAAGTFYLKDLNIIPAK